MKNIVKVGVIFDQPSTIGGGFTHAINLCEDILSIKNKEIEFKFYCFNNNAQKALVDKKISSKIIKFNFLEKLLLKFWSIFFNNKIINFFKNSPLDNFFKDEGIDLVLFTNPSTESIFLKKTNFIYTLWDICHADHPEFPEIRNNYEFVVRENVYNWSCGMATSVFVDSEMTANKISSRYNIDKNKTVKINFYLNKFDDVSSPNKIVSEIINTEYFFYPAQFWAHKNHIYILKALKILKDEHNKIVKIVFVGSDRGNKDYIIKSCNELDLDKNQVIILDFVSNNNLYHLYKNSKGLIMPTYFGPTNIPPLEALYLNVPIVYPLDLAVNEDFSDLIIKIDLNEVNSLVKAILLLQNNNSFRADLLKNFNERKKNIFDFDNKKKIIEKILLFKNKRDTWE